MSKAARANLLRMQREAFRTGKSNPKLEALTKKHGMLVKPSDAKKLMRSQTVKKRGVGGGPLRTMSTVTGSRKAKELARKRRPAVGSGRGRLTAAQRRARMIAARKRAMAAARKRRAPSRRTRPSTGRLTTAMRRARLLAARRRAAARKRRGPSRRIGRPVSPRTRRAPSRGRRGLGRILRRVSRMR